MQELITQAPRMQDFLSHDEQAYFAAILARLDDAGIAYEVEPRLVRGLDYYTGMVFEWQTDQLGAQNAVCGGGRYDQLVRQLGGRDTPAVGWAMGMERLIALLGLSDATIPPADARVYLVTAGERAARAGTVMLEKLRDTLPSVRMVAHGGTGSFKSQLRAADRSGAEFALILGDDEVEQRTVAVKPLRAAAGDQVLVGWDTLDQHMAALLGADNTH
jgi:histidyl-tRNA synthetase